MEKPKAIKKKSSYCLKCIKRQLINLSEEKTQKTKQHNKSRGALFVTLKTQLF